MTPRSTAAYVVLALASVMVTASARGIPGYKSNLSLAPAQGRAGNLPCNLWTWFLRIVPSTAFAAHGRCSHLLRSSALATLGEGDLVQYAVELRPHLVSFGTPDMAKCAFRFCLDLGGRSLRLVMIEIEVTPAASVGKALRVLDGHIGSVESAGEITPPRRLVREPSGFSAGGKVSCSSLKKMVPSGNEPVFR